MEDHDQLNPWLVVAIGGATVAVLWALAAFGPTIFKGISASIGIGMAAATTGFATAGTVSPWLPVISTGGVAIIALSVGYYAIEKVVERAEARTFEWALSMLTVLSALVMDLTKDTLFRNGTERALIAAATSGLLLVGGLLMRRRNVAARIVGAILPFLPLGGIWIIAASKRQRGVTIQELLGTGPVAVWSLVGSFALAVIVVVLAFATSPGAKPTA